MTKQETIHLSVRRSDGTFAYHSKGQALLDFISRLQPTAPQITVVDFSPILVEIHNLVAKYDQRDLRKKYNSLYNSWQDAKTYTKVEVVIARSDSLTTQGNKLINELEFELHDQTKSYHFLRNVPPEVLERYAREIRDNAEIYINTLLCLIHSKASLEVGSFKNEYVLTGYADALEAKIRPIYNFLVGYSEYRHDLNEDSVLYQLAFERHAELNLFLEALPDLEFSPGLKVECFDLLQVQDVRDSSGYYMRGVSKTWQTIAYLQVNALAMFREILFQLEAVQKLLQYLKADCVHWQPKSETIEQIAEGIKLISQRRT
jgi:hypothetical protein